MLISAASAWLYLLKHYPVVSQLQADLDESIRTDAKLLDPSFPKVSEGEDVTVHVVCQFLGYSQRAALLRLNLSVTQITQTNLKAGRKQTHAIPLFPSLFSMASCRNFSGCGSGNHLNHHLHIWRFLWGGSVALMLTRWIHPSHIQIFLSHARRICCTIKPWLKEN